MNTSEFSLKQFFSAKATDLSQRLSPVLELSIKASLLKAVPKIGWALSVSGVVEKLDDLLNIRIIDIMALAWNKCGVLRKYLDKEKYPANEAIFVPLAEHTIKSDHHPFIEMLVNDKCIARLEFTINIILKLKGIILKIQDGKIKEIGTGEIKGEGTVKYGEFVIMNRDVGSISLPGSIDLGEGIAIPVLPPSRIELPPQPAADAGALVECQTCHEQVFSGLTPMEVKVLNATGVLQRTCDRCGKLTSWTYVDASRRPREFPSSGALADPARAAKTEEKVEGRKDKRLEMSLPILVLGPRGEQEVTRTENLSQGGLAVQLGMNLAVGDILRIVYPYAPGDPSVEARTEVRHCTTFSVGGRPIYGLRYLR